MSEEMTDEELSLGPGNNQEDVEEWSQRDELDDLFSETMHRVLTRDPTQRTLEIMNPLELGDSDGWTDKRMEASL